MNPTFEKLLFAKKVTNLFEKGSLEEKRNFCEKYLSETSKTINPKPPAKPEGTINFSDIKWVNYNMSVSIDNIQLSEGRYLENIADQISCEMARSVMNEILCEFQYHYDYLTVEMRCRLGVFVAQSFSPKQKSLPEAFGEIHKRTVGNQKWIP